jgi:hypothetical protein
MMKNKAYKEIVDEQRNEKEDDTALIEEALAISFKTTVKLSFSSFDYCI